MQDSSAFQFIAIDQIHESTTNPRQTFEQSKLEELADSIRQHGLIQPITVRPNSHGFEIVAGARRFRAAQLAELFSVPGRIAELNDAQAMEWQLVENSQRVDVHPYEEAQGFKRLLDLPGYDVTALVEKSGKSASHIYARLSLLQLVPVIAAAFTADRITASHANLLARLPQEHQATAFENCWRKDWNDKEAHLLPAKHLSEWIQANLYLCLADAPFDCGDTALNPAAGACVTCPRRSGFNTSLFHDVQGDQCLDSACYQTKIAAHIDRELASRPQLVQLETAWRKPSEQRPGALLRNQYRELNTPDNPDAEPPCPSSKAAIIVFGRNVGKSVVVCTDIDCPTHNPQVAAQRTAIAPPPTMAPAPEVETEEEAQARQAEYEQRRQEYEAAQQEEEEERKREFERQQEQYTAEQARRKELLALRQATFERILANAPATFSAAQLRLFLLSFVNLDPYDFAEDVAGFYGEENDGQRTAEEVLSSTVATLPDEKLTEFALRLVLTGHLDIPRESDVDYLAQADVIFTPPAEESKQSPRAPASISTKPKKKTAATPKKKLAA